MSQFSSEEFLQSFLVEADEYLQAILKTLLELENKFSSSGRIKTDFTEGEDSEIILSQLNDLLRALHSLKGISGMVGLNPAVELSHAMESVVKTVQQGQRPLSSKLIDRLIKASQLMNQIIQTVRDPSLKIPEFEGLLADLNISDGPETVPDRSSEKIPHPSL